MGVCDPIYKTVIDEMFLNHKNDRNATALVVINSFDFQKEIVEDAMDERKIIPEIFEVDRIKPNQRLEYMNCFS